MIAPARLAAYEILSALSSGHGNLAGVIERVRSSLPDPRDRALATEIATGVQRWRGQLDYLIEGFARRPLDKLDQEVLDILRLGLYQLLHLTRVPVAALVSDAVEQTRRARKSSASGLVNAVLRAVSRRRRALPLPPRPTALADRGAALDYLSVTLSHPRWLAARWFDRLGFECAERWMVFNNEPAPLTLRANRLRIDPSSLRDELAERGVSVSPGRFAPDSLLVRTGQPLQNPGADCGWFVVQDEASQLVALLAGSAPGPRVLDACASPGVKTTTLAAAVGDGGRVVACDVRAGRMALLRRTVGSTGAENVSLVQADLLSPLPFSAAFSTVLVDAPCSGLGTLRRDPDIRWRRLETDLSALAAAEERMLRNAAGVVGPGQRLVYATCSSEPEENEQVARSFLHSAPEFSLVDARSTHPALAPVVDVEGFLRTRPDEHGLESFFGAVFERRRF